MSKASEIVNLRVEVARWQALYTAAVAANADLQAQILAVVHRDPPAADIVREIMGGFKAVMNPDLPPVEPPVDVYGLPERVPVNPGLDPAWDVPSIFPDGYAETLEREAAEDGT
jgi:hypothetical protein